MTPESPTSRSRPVVAALAAFLLGVTPACAAGTDGDEPATGKPPQSNGVVRAIPPAGGFSTRVVSSDGPVGGANVSLFKEGRLVGRGSTGPDGLVTFNGLVHGSYKILVISDVGRAEETYGLHEAKGAVEIRIRPLTD